VESQWTSERRGLERFVCEQPPYSIFVRVIERELLAVTQRYGMGVIVWSPLAGGWLAGKYRRGQAPPPDSRGSRWRGTRPVFARYDVEHPQNQRKLDLVEDLERVADKAGLSLTHMSLAWTLVHPSVTSAIIGPRTMEQLEDLLAAADVVLDEATLDAIDDLVPPGTAYAEADLGWQPPWMEPSARRR
jgi:aryl-alcohol dehydrogenase-like predicted oxidoreductase